MKKVWRNIGFVAVGILGHTWYSTWIAAPKVELDSLNAKTPQLNDEKKEETAKNMAQFLAQGVLPVTTGGTIAPGQGLQPAEAPKGTQNRVERVQEAIRTMDAQDSGQVSEAARKIIAVFNEVPESDSQERITILQIVLQNQALANHSDIREFLADLVERYHAASNQDLKVVSNVAYEGYVRAETDATARDEFIKRYSDTPQAP